MEDTISRAGIDWKKERNHGSRVLPPMSVPTTSYGGPSDPYRPGAVVDELIGDERLIYHKEIGNILGFSLYKYTTVININLHKKRICY